MVGRAKAGPTVVSETVLFLALLPWNHLRRSVLGGCRASILRGRSLELKDRTKAVQKQLGHGQSRTNNGLTLITLLIINVKSR